MRNDCGDRVMEWLMQPASARWRITRFDFTVCVLVPLLLLLTLITVVSATQARAQVPFAVPEPAEPRVIRHVYPVPPYTGAPAQPVSPYRAEQFRSHGPVIPLEPSMSPYRREQLGLRSDPASASPYRQELWRSGRR